MIIHGIIYIISAPSGAGKSSLINALIKSNNVYKLKRSISYTTRSIRPGEINGKHYYFVNKNQFEKMIRKNCLLEYATVFGNYYGTSRYIVEKTISAGQDIILDIDWQGARKIRKIISKNLCSIFIFPPSKFTLIKRLKKRGSDNIEIIKKRIQQAVFDIMHFSEYDYLIINNYFNTALFNLKNIIISEKLRVVHQKIYQKNLIRKLSINK